MTDSDEIGLLKIHAVIAFDGTTPNALKCHPDGVHVLYPMGNKICVQNWITKKMEFLSGHTNSVSTVNISENGKYIGTGQINQIGSKTTVIIWDFKTRTIVATHDLHKVRVEHLIFSYDNLLTISLGGRDCGQIVVWHNELNLKKCILTATKVLTGDAITLVPLNNRFNSFISAGNENIRIWNIDLATTISTVVDVSMGKLKRYILCVAIDKNDEFGFCGTTSGDIIKISIKYPANPAELPTHSPSVVGCYAKCGQWKKNTPRPETIFYSFGVRCILLKSNGTLIVGTGSGTIDIIEEIKWQKPLPKPKIFSATSPHFKSIKMKKLNSAITSMLFMKNSKPNLKETMLIVGTKMSEIYLVNTDTFETTLVITCHISAINDVTFPRGISEVFATAGTGDIRIWSLQTCQELLRIQVSKYVCTKVLFSYNGKSLVSAWDDGCIRAFKPLSGQLIYCIVNTHVNGTSAIAMTKDCKTIISGGNEGQVRIWMIEPQKQTLIASLKEHRSKVTSIKVNNTDTEVVSAGADGSCIIWDIIQVLFTHTVCTCICYEPSNCQILTSGTDKRIQYWDAGSGLLIRELQASKNGAINAIDVDHTGELFITGGNDQVLKFWRYNEGIYTHNGLGHSGAILAVSFSPDGRFIVSTSSSGSIFIWNCPKEHLNNVNKMKEIQEKEPLSAKSSKSSSERLHSRASYHKEENISTINTARSSIIAECPCSCTEIKNKGNNKKNKDEFQCTCKKSDKLIAQKPICTPPLETRDFHC